MKISAGILLLLAAAACAPSVPSEPTWVDDVRPILAANCIRCHSPPYIYQVPSYFRLDIYDDDLFLDPASSEPVYGAAHMSDQESFKDVLVTRSTMPPRLPLTGRQVDVLTKWHEVGEPQGERADNAAPTMTVSDGPDILGPGRVGLYYEIDDPDGDIVTGAILADPGGGDPIVPTNELFVGRGRVKFSLPPGNFALTAALDDGTDRVDVDLGQVTVP